MCYASACPNNPNFEAYDCEKCTIRLYLCAKFHKIRQKLIQQLFMKRGKGVLQQKRFPDVFLK